jgi:RNA polymerase sigma-70 factor (ECF subfamily)
MFDMKGQSDGALVRRVMEGDTAAYAGLVNRYRDRLVRYATRMLGNSADAEEALQDAFVRGYRYLARCTDPDRFGAWVFGILVNRCRTLGSQRARRQRLLVQDQSALSRASVSQSEDGEALREAIEHAVAQLQPAQREAFILKYVEEMSYEEMKRITGARTSALKMRVARARQELRRLLAEVDGV